MTHHALLGLITISTSPQSPVLAMPGSHALAAYFDHLAIAPQSTIDPVIRHIRTHLGLTTHRKFQHLIILDCSNISAPFFKPIGKVTRASTKVVVAGCQCSQ